MGWTGMASASSLAHFNAGQSGDGGFETIEIDPQYAQGLGLNQGDLVRLFTLLLFPALNVFARKVEIGLLHDLPHAKSVSTEPLTSDDWEIIVRLSTVGLWRSIHIIPRKYMRPMLKLRCFLRSESRKWVKK